jgi:hypothetical protein
MKNKYFKICLICFICILISCSNRPSLIQIENNGIPYLKNDVFKLKSIQDPYLQVLINENKEPKYIIYWKNRYYDNEVAFLIHPRQILVKEMTNTPNPKFLYWILNINDMQYKEICNILDNYKISYFIYDCEKDSSDYKFYWCKSCSEMELTQKQLHCENCELLNNKFWENLKNNIDIIITELNNFFPDDVEKLSFPDSDFTKNKKSVLLKME